MVAEDLLQVLADGRYHSGQALAKRLGVTRAAIWKRVAKLRRWGLIVEARPGRGYRLDRRVDLIDPAELLRQISTRATFELDRIDVFTELASTNRYLVENPPSRTRALTVCLAEYQTAGRGRHGRSWSAPLGAGICLSLGWCFADSPPQLTALPLAVGVAVRRAIREVAGIDLGLKWPNDLVFEERKLGGVLVELTAEAQGQSHVVIGVGINVEMPDALLKTLSDWPAGAVDIRSAQPDFFVPRQALSASVILQIGELLTGYGKLGFEQCIDEWREADHLKGRSVSVQRADSCLNGIAVGIDADAALLVDVEGEGVLRIVSGDIRVRAVA